MFKKDDKVICIDNKSDFDLVLNKVYTVKSCESRFNSYDLTDEIYVMLYELPGYGFFENRFELLSKHRIIILNKLKENICLKSVIK